MFFYDYLDLPTFFGEITFHRNIVELDGFGSRLWTLDCKNDFRRNLLNFCNHLAAILNQEHVIYFGDSWAKSSWIQDWVYGKTLNEIREQITLKGLGSITEVGMSVKEDHLYIQNVTTPGASL